jgi:FkbM family methyltransferase
LAREHLTRNTKFLDIGAWIGPTGLTAAAIGARVVAFEPDPVAYKHLLANIALNPELAGQIEVHNAAAWISDGQRRLGSGRFGFGDSMSSFATESENGVIVQTVDVAKLHGDFVKIDVEGAEYDIIPRAASTLLKNRPPLLLATHGVSGGARNRMTSHVGWRSFFGLSEATDVNFFFDPPFDPLDQQTFHAHFLGSESAICFSQTLSEATAPILYPGVTLRRRLRPKPPRM